MSLSRSLGWVVFICLGVGFAVTNLAAWLLLRHDASVVVALVLGVAAAALTAGPMWRSQQPADLVWNGAEWQWRGSSGQAQVALDLDAWMLLRFDPQHGKRCWIAASRRSAPGLWPALRAALYARRPTDPLAP